MVLAIVRHRVPPIFVYERSGERLIQSLRKVRTGLHSGTRVHECLGAHTVSDERKMREKETVNIN